MIVADVLGAIVGLMLVVTGAIKLHEGSSALSSSIASFKILPQRLVAAATAVLPPVEIAAGLCLVTQASGPWPWLAAGLLALYTVSVLSVMARGISTECGCFGSVLKAQASWVVVARNGVLLAMLTPACIEALLPTGISWFAWAIFGVGVAVSLLRLSLRSGVVTVGNTPLHSHAGVLDKSVAHLREGDA